MALKATAPTPAELADLCLMQLVETPEQLADFMTLSGISPNTFRDAVGSAGFASGIIDYFVQNEPLLLALCSRHGLGPETVMRVWAKLNPAG